MKALIIFFLATGLVAVHAFAQCNLGYNLALGKPAVASSIENGGTPASAAFDGNSGTRWSSAFSDPQYIYVDLGSNNNLCEVDLQWESAYATSFHIDISTDASTWTTVATVTGNTSTSNSISITGTGRYVRMYGVARATGYGYSLWEMKVYGTATTPPCSVNAALGQPAVSSSDESIAFPASNAVDGNNSTRWSSSFSDPQTLTIDLGMIYSLCSVELDWEAAYATNFQIQTSINNSTWTTVAAITGNTSTTNLISLSGDARYVRMYGQSRATGYGYSLWEMKVFGISSLLPVTWLSFTGNATKNPDAVQLAWTTTRELNNQYFEVQRKTGNDFAAIGTVAAQTGANGGVLSYHFTDADPATGENLYRLKQVDIDGNYSFSKTIAVANSRTIENPVSVYPNPAKDILHIKAGSAAITALALFTPDGKKCLQQAGPGAGQEITLTMSKLPPGMYLLQVNSNQGQWITKILHQ